jgi:hypothetical protein
MSRWLRGMFLLPLWLGFGAQAFEGVSYQGTLTDAAGDLLSSGRYTLEFNLYKTQSDSTPVWGPQVFDDGIGTPGHSYKVEVVDGMFSVVLGERDTQGRSLSEVFMKKGEFLLLGLKVDGGPEIQPRQQIMPAPYAFRALSAPLPRVAVATPSQDVWRLDYHPNIPHDVPGLLIDDLVLKPGSLLLVTFTGVVQQTGLNTGTFPMAFEVSLVAGDETTTTFVGRWSASGSGAPQINLPTSFSQVFGPYDQGESFTSSKPIKVQIKNHDPSSYIRIYKSQSKLLAEEIIVESLSP